MTSMGGRPYGLYARHLYGRAYYLDTHQLYDKPMILVLVT